MQSSVDRGMNPPQIRKAISAVGASIVERLQGCDEPPFRLNPSGMDSEGPTGPALSVFANLTNTGVDSKLAHKHFYNKGETQWRTSW